MQRICLIAILSVLFVGGAWAQDAAAPRTISVSGTTVVKTAPDMVVWSVSLTDFNPDMLAAKHANDAKLERVFALRDELGLEAGDLETGYVRINKEYEHDEHGNQGEFKHFAVRRSVTIRQRDLDRFDEFLEKLVSSAEMEISFSFESSRMQQVRADARVAAMKIAKEKAQAMAQAVDARVGNVLSIDEHPPTQYGYNNRFQNAMMYDSGSRPTVDLASGTFAPGAIEVQVTVYATFLLQ